MPIYEANGKRYNLPDDVVSEFVKDFPGARLVEEPKKEEPKVEQPQVEEAKAVQDDFSRAGVELGHVPFRGVDADAFAERLKQSREAAPSVAFGMGDKKLPFTYESPADKNAKESLGRMKMLVEAEKYIADMTGMPRSEINVEDYVDGGRYAQRLKDIEAIVEHMGVSNFSEAKEKFISATGVVPGAGGGDEVEQLKAYLTAKRTPAGERVYDLESGSEAVSYKPREKELSKLLPKEDMAQRRYGGYSVREIETGRAPMFAETLYNRDKADQAADELLMTAGNDVAAMIGDIRARWLADDEVIAYNIGDQELITTYDRKTGEYLDNRSFIEKGIAGLNSLIAGVGPEDWSTSPEDQMILTARDLLAEAAQMREAATGDKGVIGGISDALGNWNPVKALDVITDAVYLKKLNNKIKNGEPLKMEEQILLDALKANIAVRDSYGKRVSGSYEVGKIVGDMIPYAVEMMLNPLSGTGKAAGKAAVKKMSKKFAESFGGKAVKRTAELLGSTLGGGAMALTSGLPKTIGGTISRMTGTPVSSDNEYGVDFVGAEDNYGTAFFKEWGANTLEYASEQFGASMASALTRPVTKYIGKAASKVVSKIPGGTRLLNGITHLVDETEMGKALSDFMARGNYHGVTEEFFEEVYNALANAATVGDTDLDEFFSTDNIVKTAAAVAIPGVAVHIVNGGANAVEIHNRRKAAKARIERAESAGVGIYGERWWDSAVRKNLTSDDLETVKKEMTNILNSDLSGEQKNAMIVYVVSNMEMRTLDGLQKLVASSASGEAAYAAYQDMVTAEAEALKRLKNTEHMDVGNLDEWLNGINLAAVPWNSEESYRAVREYVYAKRAFDNSRDAFKVTQQEMYDQSDEAIDSNSNNNMVYSTIYNGEEVFITGGNVVLNEDGTIDVNNSSESLYIKFPDGHKEPISANQLAGKITVQNAEELKTAGKEAIDARMKAEFDTAEAQAIEHEKRAKGIVFDMTDPEGTHRIEILNEGDDISDILLDGVPARIFTDELNQWKQEAGIQTESAVADDATDNGTPTESEANVAPTGDNVAPVAPVELPNVPDFFRLGGKNYSVVSRNDDGSVDVMVDGKRETLPAGTDYSTHIPTDKKGEVQYEQMPVERTHEYFVQRVKDDEARAEMIEKRRKKAEAERKKFDKKPDPGIDPDAYDAKMTQWEADKKAAQAKVDYWNEVAKRETEITRSKMREAVEGIQPRDVVEQTAEEFIADHMPKITPESFKKETGLSNSEQSEMVGYIANKDKGGVTIEQAAEGIVENYGDELRSLGYAGDMQDVRNLIIDILSNGNPRGYAKRGYEARVQDDIDQQRADAEAWAKGAFDMKLEELYLYEETILPRIIRDYEGFDENEYYSNLAENNGYDTTRESESIGRGSELLQGEQPVPAGGTPVVGQRNEGGAVSDDVQGGGQDGVAQEEVPVSEPVGNFEQLSSSEIPNNQSVAEGSAPGQSGVYADNQGNPIDADGKLIVEEVNSIDEITDEDFETPTRNVQLPAIPENVANAIGTNGRPVVIKKNVFEKNGNTHVELEPEDSRNILRSALYNPNLVGSTQPIRRPDYKVAIRTGDQNAVVVLDVYQEKDFVEIVGWRMVNEKGLAKMQRQAEREGGQFLILSPNDGSAAALSALPLGLSSASEGTTQSDNKQENTQKSKGNAPKRVNVESLMGALKQNGEAKLSEHVEQTTNPSGNKLVTDERYNELKERMKKKLKGQMNIGIDPEILAIGTEMAVYHLEKGARKFTEYAKVMIADLGDAIRPYLKAFYNGARELPEVAESGLASDMTSYNEVQKFDVANFDKPVIDILGTIKTVAREAEVQQDVETATERIKKVRSNNENNNKTVNSLQNQLDLFDNGTENENTRTDNRGAQLRREELPDTEQVGAGVPIQDTARNSKSKRRDAGVGSSKLGNGPQYDVNRNYTNEEIEEIVSSVTDIVDGKVVITGEVTDDIKAIVRGYESGGIAKKGRGILDEYYTDGKIVDAVNLLIAPYFNSSTPIRVLEPSVGIGNFIQAVNNIPTSEVVAFEINETTARIAKILYPDVDVNLRSFETEFIDESGNKKPMPQKYSLVIGNPPYGSHRGLYKGLGEESKIARYEDYFVKRSLDVLDEGGVLAMVLPSSWMDRHTKFGGYTIERAYRLPSGAFEATQVGTDIVILKKDSSVPVAEHAPYFEQFPERVLGEVKQRKGRYGRLEEYVEGDIDAAIEAIEKENAEQVADLLDIEKNNDALNDIESAVDETGSPEKAIAIVKDAKNSEKTDKKPATKQGKYKVKLNRGVETVPTSAQFTHEFSDGEVEAFADTDYEGALSNPAKHRRYANYIGGQAVHDFYYAEGDIYSKLAQLEQEKDYIIKNYGVEQYEKQKALLESVLPKQKSLEEITISPNTAFVKNLNILTENGKVSLKDMFVEFCRKLPYQAFGNSSVWEVIGYVNNEQVHGTDKSRNQRIRERRKRTANDLFNKFLNEELSDNAKKQVVASFNREYNSTYRPDYSKVPMFSTINRDFKGKPLKLTSVQLAGIGRMTVKGVGVLAHEVGFGKTLSGILAMHEAMTRGFAKKPLIVVPNDNILKQWVETIGEVLPNATVNTLGNLGAGYDLTDFKVNDGEFTIITYEGFKAMSFSDFTYNHFASKFSYITEDLNKHQSERDIQKEIEKKNELKGKMKRGTKSSYMFEDFGFDWLTVDEVHNANHIVSKVRLDKSVASDFRSQSQRTSDLGLKTWLAAQYIQEENNGRNVLLLSATPFTNKPLEYYSILSLVGNDMLERKGFFNVDQFFATFMEADNELEIGANGRPMQKTNVRRFRNNGLFQQLLSEFIDIKGEEDNPELVRPERLNKEYKIAQNELTAEAMAAAQELLGDNDTVLQGIGHARAAAFSPYATSLLGRQPKNHKEFVKNSPKIDATIKMIEQNIKDRPDAGQIVYSEVGVEYFPLIRDYLVKESGLKPNEVRIITGATSNNERVNIQSEFNDGKVKVVIGSPAIKEGLNLQGNTTDMYILSLPWNFTQLRQIEGRGWRQGNKWENIRINYMLTNDSVDVFMLQRLQLKQGLYNKAMKSGAESLDVSDIDTAELKTALITDPAVRAEIVTVQEREKLQLEKTQIEADLSFVMRKYEAYNKLVNKLDSQKNTVKLYKEWAQKGDEYWAQRVEREEAQLKNIENEIEEEKQNLAKKGVNVDDIVRQTEQAQNDIVDIQEKIDNLKEFQEELTQRYREENEAKAKEQGDLLSSYIKERKAENKGFYKIRPAKSETKAAEENTEDDVAFRQGDGPLTDREVVMESDVYSKVLGKPRYYGQKQRNYVARQRAKMAQKATELAEKLNTPIEVRETAEGLTGKKAKAKGWYDVKSGNIVVVVSNHGSIEDIQATVLHEVVAHKGLRQMFGEHFDTFLDNVYNNVDAEIRAEIDALTDKYGNTREATEEYLASLAENTYFEKVNPSLWSRIKQWFLNMLTEAGIKLDFELSDNELRYILWRSHQRLVNPGIYNPVTRITDVAVRARLGIGEYAPAVEEMSHAAEEDVVEYANKNQDIFVSNAQRAVEGIQQNKATAEQWIAMLKKNGGLKAGEDAWLGLEEWLNEKQGAVTKQEILDYIAQNRIQIEEVEYGDDSSVVNDSAFNDAFYVEEDAYGEPSVKVKDARMAIWLYNREYPFRKMSNNIAEITDEEFNELEYFGEEYFKRGIGDVKLINSTRLGYTTDGLENKREIALVVPTIESWNASDEIHFGDAGNGRAVAWVRFGETTDSEGNRVLVIDEIQSKRHQDAREKGYKNASRQELESAVDAWDEAQNRYDAYNAEMAAKYGTTIEDWPAVATDAEIERYEELYNEVIKAGDVQEQIAENFYSGVPAAPFEKNWHELAMKRMLRLAAEEGFDKVAWTTGEQQAQRYDIGAVVNRIESNDTVDYDSKLGVDLVKQVVLFTRDGNAITLRLTPEGIVRASSQYNGHHISDIVGKELGNRIMTETDLVLKEQDLRIGGEGMKGFYDKILPSFVQKYTKKWGAKVGEVTMPNLGENNTMHSVDVTPEMQESVMQGQTMFRVINEQAEEFNKSHKGGARVVNIDPSNMEAELAEEGFGTEDIQYFKERVEKGAQAFYDPERDLIYLFDPTVSKEDLKPILWHEDTHKAISDLDIDQDLLNEFYALINKDRKKSFETIAERGGYEKEEYPEECVACCIQGLSTHGRWNARALARITKATVEDADRQFEIIQPLIDYIKYGRETEENIRRESLDRADVASKMYDTESAKFEKEAEEGAGDAETTRGFGQEGETRFRTVEETTEGSIDDVPAQPLTLMERITNSLLEVSAKNKENLGLRADALRTFGRDINRVLSLMKAQKEYDKSTVDTLVKLAKMYFKNAQLLGEVDTYTMGRVLSLINNVVGKRDVTASAAKLMDILLDAHTKALAGILDKAEKVKAKKVNAAGVEVMGRLDKYGQKRVDEYRAAKEMTPEKLEEAIYDSDNRLAELEQRVREELGLPEGDVDQAARDYTGDNDVVNVYMDERARFEGLTLAREYKESIQQAEEEIKDLKRELKQAKEDYRLGNIDGKSLKEFRKSVAEAIMESKAGLIESYHSLIYKFQENTKESSKKAKAFAQAQIDRAREIQHNANSDMEGISAATQGTHPKNYNNAVMNALRSLFPTLQGMLKKFGEKNVEGKGYLYERFIPQATKAGDNEFRGKVAARVMIEGKLKEIYGKKMTIAKFMKQLREYGATVTYREGNEMKQFDLTKGQMLYIYMVNKMSDGQMKLRRMGITDDVVAELMTKLPVRAVHIADWAQNELLKNLRGKYNAVHERVFGAPMAAIENYFPIKIRKEARGEKGDVSEVGQEGKPSTVTGSIIKRTKNATAIDLSADAMQVLMEHIDDMEHWAAFAEFNRDLNVLLNYKHFQNQVKNMTSVRYGSGEEMWKNFKKTAQIVSGTYRPSDSSIDRAVQNIAKGLTRSKINFRLYTAIKQLLSAPAFWTDAGVKELAYCYANPKGSFDWAKENLPGFAERWQGRTIGNEKLLKSDSDWEVWRNKFVENATRWGITPNAAIDALTVAQGARAVYMTKLEQFKKAGYTEQRANEKALQAAAEAYNESQQSSEGIYLSPLQVEGTVASAIFSTFKNSNFGYTRKTAQAVANIKRKMRKGYKEETIAFMAKQMIRDGLSEADAKRMAEKVYNKSKYRDVANVAMFGFGLNLLWEAGGYAIYLLLGDDDEEKEKMRKEIAFRGSLGLLNGIPFGETMISAAMAVKEGDTKYFRLPQLVAVGDIENLAQVLNYDPVRGANDIVNMFTSIGVGVTPQVLTDILVAVDDIEEFSAEELGMFAARFVNAPQSNLDRLMVDDAMENSAINAEEIMQRYAEYKKSKNAPITQFLYSDEEEQKAVERYEKRFAKLLDERLENVVEDNDAYDLFYENADVKMKSKLAKMRQKYLAGDKAKDFEKLDAKELVERVLYGSGEINETYFNLSTAEDEDAALAIKIELKKHEDIYNKGKDLKGEEWGNFKKANSKEYYLYEDLKSIERKISNEKTYMEKNPEKADKSMEYIRKKRAEAIKLINKYYNE